MEGRLMCGRDTDVCMDGGLMCGGDTDVWKGD